jgi:hypothetical protein
LERLIALSILSVARSIESPITPLGMLFGFNWLV